MPIARSPSSSRLHSVTSATSRSVSLTGRGRRVARMRKVIILTFSLICFCMHDVNHFLHIVVAIRSNRDPNESEREYLIRTGKITPFAHMDGLERTTQSDETGECPPLSLLILVSSLTSSLHRPQSPLHRCRCRCSGINVSP